MKELALFLGISSANHLVFMGVRLAVVLAAVQLGASAGVVGMLAAMFGLVSVFFSVAAGRLMDRVGPARPMIWCSVLMAIGAGFGFVWSSIASLFIVSTLVGTFYSLFFVGHTQWIGRIGAPRDRVRNFSYAALGFSGASFLGPLVVGFLIDHFGHASAFGVLALVPLFPIAVLAANVLEHPSGSGAHAAKAAPGSLMALVRDRRMFRVYCVSVLAHATWSIISFLFPVYCVQIGMSASMIGVVMGAYAIAAVVIRVFMQPLSRRFTNWQLMLLSLASSGVCFVVFPLVSGVAALVGLAFFIGLGMGLSGPLSQALLYEVAPAERIGEVMGLRVTAINLTQTLVPLASGAASAALGVAPVFWALAAALLAGSYATRRQWRLPRGSKA